MISGPVVQVLYGENAVENYRNMGSTNPELADEGTIRKFAINIGKFGVYQIL